MNVSAISLVNPNNNIHFRGKSAEMSDKEKQELILKARTKASGYAFWGGSLSTLYYAFRSNEKIARKFNLDVNEDKKLIEKIKREQVKWTIPAALTNILDAGSMLGFLSKKTRIASVLIGGGTYLYNKCFAKAKDIDLE